MGGQGEPESGGEKKPSQQLTSDRTPAWWRWLKENLQVKGDDFRTQPDAAVHHPRSVSNPAPEPNLQSGIRQTMRDLLCVPFDPEARRTVLLTILKFRAPAIGALLVSIFLAFPEQTHEIYVKLAEDFILTAPVSLEDRISGPFDLLGRLVNVVDNWELYRSFLIIFWTSFSFWICARWIGFRAIVRRPDDDRAGRVQNIIVLWFPRILGTSPLLALAYGTSSTSRSYGGTVVSGELQTIAEVSLTLAAAFIVFLMFLNWAFNRLKRYLARLRAKSRPQPRTEQSSGGQHLFDPGGIVVQFVDTLLTYFPVMTLVIYLVAFPAFGPGFLDIDTVQARGPIVILCLFAYVFTFTLTALFLLSRRGFRLPWTGILVTWILVLSYTGWSDNDRLSQSATQTKPDQLDTPTDFYRTWRYINPESAPIVIAAQGGGLYAAYHAAMVLARLHDTEDMGARVLAVSAVSGGAVGAAVFDVIHRSGVCRPLSGGRLKENCYANMVRKVLRRDFLSPVLESMLVPDFIARIVPNISGITDKLSRARRLEDAFDDALRDALSASLGISESKVNALLDAPILAPPRISSRPLLMLNATDVNTGERMVMSPLRAFANSSPATFAEVTGCLKVEACRGPDVLAAAIVSARFPYVTPAAEVTVRDQPGQDSPSLEASARYADGGYFDNSGIETARDFIRSIKFRDDEVGKNGKLIELVAMDFPPRFTAPKDRENPFDELLAPVRTLASTRRARGELAERRAEAESGNRFRYLTLRLNDTERSFTLGWTLSDLTFDRIECHLWNDGACERIRMISGTMTRDNDAEETSIQKWNRCVLRTLQEGRQDNGEAEICDSKGTSGSF